MSLDPIVQLFKSLAHPNRLMIVGLLHQGEFSVEELASLLSLRPATISHHLSRLNVAGLVRVRVDGHYRAYSLDPERVQQLIDFLADTQSYSELAQHAGLDDYEQRTLHEFLDTPLADRTLPMGAGNRRIILHHISGSFKPDRRYTLTELNELLGQFHSDTLALRRLLLDQGLLDFQAGGYVTTSGVEAESPSGLGIWD